MLLYRSDQFEYPTSRLQVDVRHQNKKTLQKPVAFAVRYIPTRFENKKTETLHKLKENDPSKGALSKISKRIDKYNATCGRVSFGKHHCLSQQTASSHISYKVVCFFAFSFEHAQAC